MSDGAGAAARRRELADLIAFELLGPKGGPDEEVAESHVVDRYLVGMLAPPDTPLGQEQDTDEVGAGETAHDTENGTDAAVTPRPDTLFPSSMGMTFVVDGDQRAIRVSAEWGQYLREDSATLTTEAGNPKKVWVRHPRGAAEELPLREGQVDAFAADPAQPGVRVRGLVRRRDDRWIVTLFLVNDQPKPEKNLDEAWIFQVALGAESLDGSPVFLRKQVTPPRRAGDPRNAEDREMAMLYREEGEFAVGHGTAVHVEVDPGDPWRARAVRTVAMPGHEVRQQTPRTPEDPGSETLAGLVLDMKVLAEAGPGDLAGMLSPLADAYEAWIDARAAEKSDPARHLEEFGSEVDEAVARAREACRRIREGIDALGSRADAAEAFRFANHAMWLQRVHSQVAERRRRDPGLSAEELRQEIDGDPGNRSWRPFQLAFVLLNLSSIADPTHPERAGIADLLWFPTGGGKTEAYLGLSAFTMGLRRLQGVLGGRVGDRGVAVLMRYTLRLLTVQQFQRAAALICACEAIRRDAAAGGDTRWGKVPFRIGLWVGKQSSPNYTAQAAEAIASERGQGRGSGTGSPAQLTACPWCGSRLEAQKHIEVESFAAGRGRTLTYCSDKLGRCRFSRKKSAGEGIPVVVVDEEIYRLLPDLLVATVDKFAMLAWDGRTQMLFGQVDSVCERHGFRTAGVEDADSHPKRADLPSARSVPHPDLRPPDLIVQDELHLIAGPLGSLVGLYETAVEELCAWDLDGNTVRPKVVASTATVRNAAAQVHGLFARSVAIFPPPGTSASDNFFSVQRDPADKPGRLYLGICAPGKRLKSALIRTYQAALAGAQVLYDRDGRAADPWMTLVGYFNSLRELAGMRRLVDDDVANHLKSMDERGLAKRHFGRQVEELTSRRTSTEIPEILDALELPFDPQLDAERKSKRKAGGHGGPQPIDVLLATNMVSVGVDVQRLGLMIVGGQPKTTAEYIQATSRVGRRYPGLVLTVYNWARPRDLSHYERFEHYHATFYRHVESLSLTPFAQGAIERGLTALLVALVREAGPEFNANTGAGAVTKDHPYVRRAIDTIVSRVEHVLQDRSAADEVRGYLRTRLDDWAKEVAKTKLLGYQRDREDSIPLLHWPDGGAWREFTCPSSLREVEPASGLLLDEPAER
jgi:hypothetical protein